MALEVTRRRFTADEYHQMALAGILSERDRVELVDGEIVARMTFGPRHCAAVDRAARAMFLTVGDHAIVRVQGAARLDLFNEPEPDILLLRPRHDFYASGHPSGANILLVLEIADTSFEYDRDVKGPIYARLGVLEYWIADINEQRVLRYALPANGVYRRVDAHRRGRTLSPQLLPDCAVAVDDLLAD